MISRKSCDIKYTVESGLFCSLQDNGSITLGGSISNEFVWLNGKGRMEAFLNNNITGCCDVDTVAECGCRIGADVGMGWGLSGCSDEPNYSESNRSTTVLLVVMGKKLASLSPPGEVDAWSPTWQNLMLNLKYFVQEAFKERAPRSEVPNSMAETLQSFVVPASSSSDGLPNSWALAFEADIPMATLVQATKSGVAKVTADSMLRAGEALCTNPTAVRTFLWWYIDCNMEFLGNGKGPDGRDEYFSIPNQLVSTLVDPPTRLVQVSLASAP